MTSQELSLETLNQLAKELNVAVAKFNAAENEYVEVKKRWHEALSNRANQDKYYRQFNIDR